MKYRTFAGMRMAAVVGVTALGLGWCTVHTMHSSNATPQVATQTPPPPAPTPPQPIIPPYTAPIQQLPQSTVEGRRSDLENWLSSNGNRQGRMKLQNILPNAYFKVTVVRFKEEDAAKFSNDSSQWSQFRVDLNRDGRDDEKWLLKNGHTYKLEVLDRDGKTVGTPQYFDR